MKALIRRNGETVRETDGIEGIDWKTGAPLTGENWCGGAYTLVGDYTEPVSEGDAVVTESAAEKTAPAETVEAESEAKQALAERSGAEKTYTIDGKEYTKKELLSLLG